MLYYTEKFKLILNKIIKNSENSVAKYLLDIEGTESKYTFLSCDESKDPIISYHKNDTIFKFLRGKKDIEILNRFYPSKSLKFYYDNEHKLKDRQYIRAGKFLKSLDKFNDRDIEEFVNLFKVAKSIDSEEIISIVSGQDIKEWYNIKKYYNGSGWSMMHGSCMAAVNKKLFNIYSDNPDKCRMVIITKDDRLLARALVWKLDKPFNGCEYYMDRVYSIDDRLMYKLREYASENNWCRRKQYENFINIGAKEFKKNKVTITLKNHDYDYYPYMDSFRRLDKGVLHNDFNEKSFGKILDRTNGDYSRCSPSLFKYFLRKIKII